jgi:rod shape-determining protein MreC
LLRSPPPLFNQGTPAFIKLGLCFIISLSLMFVDYRYKATDKFRAITQTFLYPLQVATSWPGKALGQISDSFVTQQTLKDKVVQQNNQLVDLTLLANHAESLNAENVNLRKLLNLQQQSQFKTLAAEIIFNPTNPISQKIVINRGAADGLQLGMPVASDAGIMGQIVRVFQNSSEVALLEDRDLAIPIQVARNGLRGALFGMGRGEPLELRYISAIGELDVGDYLTTSGIDGTYPPGFPVAMITKIERSTDSSLPAITCQPLADINKYKHLMVVFYKPSTLAPPPPPPPPSIKGAAIGKRNVKK